jgi:hypothetical protein
MNILSAVTQIVGDLLIFVGAMAVLLVVLIVVVSRLPADNPLKRVLVALCFRVAATLGAGVIAIPLEPIPGIDVAYDVVAPVLLVIYWLSFFVTAFRSPRPRA